MSFSARIFYRWQGVHPLSLLHIVSRLLERWTSGDPGRPTDEHMVWCRLQLPPGTQVPVMFDLTQLPPHLLQLRLMIYPDSAQQPSNVFQVSCMSASPAEAMSQPALLWNICHWR